MADLRDPQVYKALLKIYLALAHENEHAEEGAPSLIEGFIKSTMEVERQRVLSYEDSWDFWIQQHKGLLLATSGAILAAATGVGVYFYHKAKSKEEEDVKEAADSDLIIFEEPEVPGSFDYKSELDNLLGDSKVPEFHSNLYTLIPSESQTNIRFEPSINKPKGYVNLDEINTDKDLLNSIDLLEIDGAESLNIDLSLYLGGLSVHCYGDNPNQKLNFDLGFDGVSFVYSVVL